MLHCHYGNHATVRLPQDPVVTRRQPNTDTGSMIIACTVRFANVRLVRISECGTLIVLFEECLDMVVWVLCVCDLFLVCVCFYVRVHDYQ